MAGWRHRIRAGGCAALLGAAALVAAGMIGSAAPAQVTALAIMLPEEPTDFGWNQQAFQADAREFQLLVVILG